MRGPRAALRSVAREGFLDLLKGAVMVVTAVRGEISAHTDAARNCLCPWCASAAMDSIFWRVGFYRSSRHATNVSPSRRWERRSLSCGRVVVAPDAVSVQTLKQPAALRASLCGSTV